MQPTVSQYPVKAYEGLLADSGIKDIITGANGTASNIGFGLGVFFTDDDGVNVGHSVDNTSTLPFAGFTVRHHRGHNTIADPANEQGYDAPKEDMNILRKGRINVRFIGDASGFKVGDPVFIFTEANTTNGVFAGEVTNSTALDAEVIEVTGAKFTSSGQSQDITVIEVNL